MKLLNGDCLELMGSIPDRSVDLVLVDLPYGSTDCAWDSRIDPVALWAQYKRLLKPTGNVVMTADFRFAVTLFNSAPKGWFRDDTVWDKVYTVGFLNAKKKPLRQHELILHFAPKGASTYRPQMGVGRPYSSKASTKLAGGDTGRAQVYRTHKRVESVNTGTRYPTSIVQFKNVRSGPDRWHPTQKPPELIDYLIETYSEPLDVVLDNTMGSGSTGHGCLRTGRQFIGIERDPLYFARTARDLARAGASIDFGASGSNYAVA